MSRLIKEMLKNDSYSQEGLNDFIRKIKDTFSKKKEEFRRNRELTSKIDDYNQQAKEVLEDIVNRLGSGLKISAPDKYDVGVLAFGSTSSDDYIVLEILPIGIYEDVGIEKEFVNHENGLTTVGHTDSNFIERLTYYQIHKADNPKELYKEALEQTSENLASVAPADIVYPNPPVTELSGRARYQLVISVNGGSEFDHRKVDPAHLFQTLCAEVIHFDDADNRNFKKIEQTFNNLIIESGKKPWERTTYHEVEDS